MHLLLESDPLELSLIIFFPKRMSFLPLSKELSTNRYDFRKFKVLIVSVT